MSRMGCAWNDDEDAALLGLPHLARVLYLQGLRRHMDFRTGIVGKRRGISYQSLREVAYIDPIPGSHTSTRPITQGMLRNVLEQLEKRGLLERRSEDRQLIFFLPLASRDDSVSRRNNRGATEEQQRSNDRDKTPKNNGIGGSSNIGATEARPVRSDTPPVSGIRRRKSPAKRLTAQELLTAAAIDAHCVRGVLGEWVEYKQASRNPYTSAIGVTKASKLLGGASPEDQQRMVDKAISGNWQGLPDPPRSSNEAHFRSREARRNGINEAIDENARAALAKVS